MDSLTTGAVRLFAAVVLVTSATSAASASGNDFFGSPTGNIGCAYAADLGYVRCDVRDGVKPLAPMPKSCQLDWGQGFWLHTTGKATIVCAGDTALGAGRVLPYGTTWKRGPFQDDGRPVLPRSRQGGAASQRRAEPGARFRDTVTAMGSPETWPVTYHIALTGTRSI